jgi:hypothetical protein
VLGAVVDVAVALAVGVTDGDAVAEAVTLGEAVGAGGFGDVGVGEEVVAGVAARGAPRSPQHAGRPAHNATALRVYAAWRKTRFKDEIPAKRPSPPLARIRGAAEGTQELGPAKA